MTGEELYGEYRAASRLRAIEIPEWFNLHPIQREIWRTMADNLPEDEDAIDEGAIIDSLNEVRAAAKEALSLLGVSVEDKPAQTTTDGE